MKERIMKEGIMCLFLTMLIPNIAVTAPDNKPESLPATENKQEETIKILGLGNSFLINVANYFPGVVKAAGHDLTFFAAAPGGCTLQRHYDLAMLNEEEPENPMGKPYFRRDRYGKRIGDGISLKDVLTSDKWDLCHNPTVKPEQFQNRNLQTLCQKSL